MSLLKILFICLEVVILFNLIIIVHELGHFLAARWRGLVVERFGIWFGKPLWQKEINGVVYCLGSIPAGGFVALPQMAPMEMIEGKGKKGEEVEHKELPPISPLDKIIVAFAGPMFSFGLAILFAGLVWGIGRPVSEADATTVVGYVYKDSPAEKAGVLPGDRILKVDGFPVTRFSGIGDTIMWRVVSSEGDTIPLQVERDGNTLNLESGYTREETGRLQRKSLRQIQIEPQKSALIARIKPNSPAARAGLRPNDIVLTVDGLHLHHPGALGDYIQKLGAGKDMTLGIRRGKDSLDVRLSAEQPIYPPEIPKEKQAPLIGIEWETSGLWTVDHPAPGAQLRMSVMAMVNTFSALFSPKSDVKAQHLTGPVGIMRIYYILFESEQGWRQAIWFSVILNVNLALLNLLPIPVLDGGHITLAIIEAIRRKPVGFRVLSILQNTCAVLIIGYMLYITFYDVQDLPWRRAEQPEIRFAPAPGSPTSSAR